MKMLYAFVAFFACVMYVAAQGKTCQEIETCNHDVAEYQEAEKNLNFAKMCEMMASTTKCMHEALEDCRKTGMLPEEQINAILSKGGAEMEQAKTMCQAIQNGGSPPVMTHEGAGGNPPVMTHEGAGGNPPVVASGGAEAETPGANTELSYKTEMAVPTNPQCKDMLNCISGMGRVIQLAGSEKTEEACSLMKPRIICLQVSLDDCDSKGALGPQVEQGRDSLAKTQQMLKEHCGGNGSGVATYSFLTLVLSCLLLVLPKVF